MPSVYDLIRSAVVNKQQIIAKYKGHRREMCPHAIGAKGGLPHALFFQFAEDSESVMKYNRQWLCIPVSRLSNVLVRDGAWYTASATSFTRSCIDSIDVQAAG